MEDRIQHFRQPLITVTGIILGFSLNAISGWLPTSFKSDRVAEILMAFGSVVHIPLYIIVIYRTLNVDYPKENAEKYFKTTLSLFLLGLVIFYFTILGMVTEAYVARRVIP